MDISQGLRHLSSVDDKMKDLINSLPHPIFNSNEIYFSSLVKYLIQAKNNKLKRKIVDANECQSISENFILLGQKNSQHENNDVSNQWHRLNFHDP